MDSQKLTKELLEGLSRQQQVVLLRERIDELTLAERFTLLHEIGLYHHPESLSGAGSTIAESDSLRRALPRLLRTYGIRSLLDIPCGDFHWMSRVDLGQVEYVGADIVPTIVERNRRLHPRRHFLVLDLTKDSLPDVDLILTRDLLIHLSLEDIRRALVNVLTSRADWLLASHYAARCGNPEISSGDFRPVNLCRAPIGFPEPTEIVLERSELENGEFRDRSMALWKLDDLRNGSFPFLSRA